ncbi:MAG: radical SAM protein [Sphaerochaetaceae bacterium]|nr:radical SAM protein [Sphaerochaetaceae bacterium]
MPKTTQEETANKDLTAVEIHSCAAENSTMSFPLGALCIKTALNTMKPQVFRAAVYENLVTYDYREQAEKCAERKPQAVGLSVYIWNYEWMCSFAAELKRLYPEVIVFAGGPQASAFRADFPDFLNFAVTGEGEVTTPRLLLKAFELKKEGKEIKEVVQSELPDLNTLESPFLSGQADNQLRNTDAVLWEMTRGCPFGCAFCFESRGNRSVRDYPIERIKEEFFYLLKFDICKVFVLDPTFNLNMDRAKEILTFLIENAPADMHFTFEIRAELIDSELARLLASLNCSVQIGLQSSDEKVLKNINRSFDRARFERNMKLLSREGVAFGLDVIIGLPGDTLHTFRSTLDFAVSLQPSNIDCFILSLLPGTELNEKKELLGLKTDESVMRNLVSSPTFSEKDICQAKDLAHAMDLFYTKGEADMWIHCILETLNISACNLFSLFSKWMKQTGRSEEEDIWILQDDFVTSLFEKTSNGKLVPAIRSFMELHQGLCYVRDCGEPATLELSYTPDDLSVLDRMSLSEFVKTRKPRHCTPTIDLDYDGSVIIR